MANVTKTSNTSIMGAVEAVSKIMKFGNSHKVGFKVGSEWYNLIGKETFLNEQIEKVKDAKQVNLSFEVKPWVNSQGEQHQDYRVKTIDVAKAEPKSKKEPVKTAAEDNQYDDKGPDTSTIIRRLALLKVAAHVLQAIPFQEDLKPAEYVELTKGMAESFELWVMA